MRIGIGVNSRRSRGKLCRVRLLFDQNLLDGPGCCRREVQQLA